MLRTKCKKLIEVLDVIENEAKSYYLKDFAHSWSHIRRVRSLAQEIAKEDEKVDYWILEPAILLHDIERQKEDEDKTGEVCHAEESAKTASIILSNIFEYPKGKICYVEHCVKTHRFRAREKPCTIEAKILFDADKLDAIGAVGIARAFSYAGEHGVALYPRLDIADYKRLNIDESGKIKDNSLHSPIYEYHLKLKHVKNKLFTKRGKEIANERIRFMDEFFERFLKEYEGKL